MSGEAKHTPGKWVRVREGSGTNPNVGDWGVDSERGANVCSYATKADARLISAAPDLLEALEGMIARASQHGMEWAQIDFARAAIAKAKGEA